MDDSATIKTPLYPQQGPTCELKWQDEEQCWNQHRSVVPELLQHAKVPRQVWEQTYDKVAEFNENFPQQSHAFLAQISGGLASVGFLSAVVLSTDAVPDSYETYVGLPTLILLFGGSSLWMWATCFSQRHRSHALGKLRKDLVHVYSPYGIEVGFTSGYSFSDRTLGLRFGAKQLPATRAVSKELAQLHELHKAGALTDLEYSQAKALVLGLSLALEPEIDTRKSGSLDYYESSHKEIV